MNNIRSSRRAARGPFWNCLRAASARIGAPGEIRRMMDTIRLGKPMRITRRRSPSRPNRGLFVVFFECRRPGLDQIFDFARVFAKGHDRSREPDQHERAGIPDAAFDPVVKLAPMRRRSPELV